MYVYGGGGGGMEFTGRISKREEMGESFLWPFHY